MRMPDRRSLVLLLLLQLNFGTSAMQTRAPSTITQAGESLKYQATSTTSQTTMTSAFFSSATALLTLQTPTEGTPAQITTTIAGLDFDAPDGHGVSAKRKYHQTTYYSCVAWPLTTHCGYHEPILPGGDEISGAQKSSQFHGCIYYLMSIICFIWAAF